MAEHICELADAELEACQVTLATIRRHAERVLEIMGATELPRTYNDAHGQGYAKGMRQILAILNMHGRPKNEPVNFG